MEKSDIIRAKKYDEVVHNIIKAMKGLKINECVALLEEIKIDIIMNKIVKISGEIGTDKKRI